MSDVTRPDLEAIQARVDAATDGPWHVEHGRIHAGTPDQFDPLAIASMLGSRAWLPDALFMAAAREDVPALLAALAAERARVDQMVPREQYDRQLGRLADDSRRHLTRARAAEQEAAAQRARADQAERDVKRYEERARENRELLDQFAARADQAEQRIADALQSLADSMPRYGMELRPDGSEDPLAAAYVEGYGTAYQPVHAILSAAPTAEQGEK